MKKEIKIAIIVVIAGALLGIASKASDVMSQGDLIHNLIFGFGQLTSAFTIWIFACLLISNKSPSKKYAMVNVIVFLLSMLCAYYIYSKFVVGYLSLKIVLFWSIMLLPAGIASNFIYGIKTKSKNFKIAVMTLSVILSLIGIFDPMKKSL